MSLQLELSLRRGASTKCCGNIPVARSTKNAMHYWPEKSKTPSLIHLAPPFTAQKHMAKEQRVEDHNSVGYTLQTEESTSKETVKVTHVTFLSLRAATRLIRHSNLDLAWNHQSTTQSTENVLKSTLMIDCLIFSHASDMALGMEVPVRWLVSRPSVGKCLHANTLN